MTDNYKVGEIQTKGYDATKVVCSCSNGHVWEDVSPENPIVPPTGYLIVSSPTILSGPWCAKCIVDMISGTGKTVSKVTFRS